MEEKRCAHCGCPLDLNPRSKNQRYCGKQECQRARKRMWQKNKMATDPDYRPINRIATRPGRRRTGTTGAITGRIIPGTRKGIGCCKKPGGAGDALQRWTRQKQIHSLERGLTGWSRKRALQRWTRSPVKSFWFRSLEGVHVRCKRGLDVHGRPQAANVAHDDGGKP